MTGGLSQLHQGDVVATVGAVDASSSEMVVRQGDCDAVSSTVSLVDQGQRKTCPFVLIHSLGQW